MKQLTARQKECLILIQAKLEAHGMSPTYEELRVALGLKSKHGVFNLIDALVRERFITRRAKHARGIELLPTEEHHATDCICLGCGKARYFRSLHLVHALEMPPPVSIVSKLAGLKAVSLLTQVYWRSGFPRSEAGAKSRVKAVQR